MKLLNKNKGWATNSSSFSTILSSIIDELYKNKKITTLGKISLHFNEENDYKDDMSTEFLVSNSQEIISCSVKMDSTEFKSISEIIFSIKLTNDEILKINNIIGDYDDNNVGNVEIENALIDFFKGYKEQGMLNSNLEEYNQIIDKLQNEADEFNFEFLDENIMIIYPEWFNIH